MEIVCRSEAYRRFESSSLRQEIKGFPSFLESLLFLFNHTVFTHLTPLLTPNPRAEDFFFISLFPWTGRRSEKRAYQLISFFKLGLVSAWTYERDFFKPRLPNARMRAHAYTRTRFSLIISLYKYIRYLLTTF